MDKLLSKRKQINLSQTFFNYTTISKTKLTFLYWIRSLQEEIKLTLFIPNRFTKGGYQSKAAILSRVSKITIVYRRNPTFVTDVMR